MVTYVTRINSYPCTDIATMASEQQEKRRKLTKGERKNIWLRKLSKDGAHSVSMNDTTDNVKETSLDASNVQHAETTKCEVKIERITHQSSQNSYPFRLIDTKISTEAYVSAHEHFNEHHRSCAKHSAYPSSPEYINTATDTIESIVYKCNKCNRILHQRNAYRKVAIETPESTTICSEKQLRFSLAGKNLAKENLFP